MFFATTALQDFWNKNERMLFAGSWCLLIDRQQDWQSLDYDVLDCPWSDPKKVSQAYQCCLETYEKVLGLLADFLNEHHHEERSLRYWRILIGPWLHYYIDILYDRLSHIQLALLRDSELTTRLLDPSSYRTPFDTLEFINFTMLDHYNLQLYSQIFRALGFSFKSQPAKPERPLKTSILPIGVVKNSKKRTFIDLAASDFKKMTLRLLGSVIQITGRSRCKLFDADMNEEQLLGLMLKSGLRILPPSVNHPNFDHLQKKCPKRHSARNKFSELPFYNALEEILIKTLSVNFPPLYLEYYRDAKKAIQDESEILPAISVSSFGWRYHEPFKFLAAESQERGKRLVAIQHGGAYGTYERHAQEIHEAKCADTFWVWGWASQAGSNLRNIPSPRLLQTIQRSTNAARPFLYLATAQPRYPIGFHSSPIGSQWEQYFEWQERFLSSLSSSIRSQMIFRSGIYEYGFQNKIRLENKFPELLFDSSKSLEKALQEATLVIIDYGGATVFLETMARNIPTLHFFDPMIWDLRKAAKPFYHDLETCDVIALQPEKAAQIMRLQSRDISTWWQNESLQSARMAFVNQFALHHPEWETTWIESLNFEWNQHQQSIKNKESTAKH